MPSSIFQKFEVDSTLEYSADHYDVTFIGSQPFREHTTSDVVTIKTGFISGTGAPQVITLVDAGPVDEFEIEILPDKIIGQKHGRNQGAGILDTLFEKRYYRFPETVPADVEQFDSVGTKLPTPPPGVSGLFNASFIAKEAVEIAGLTLAWGIPDYELQSTFFASGRIIDTLRKLIRPYSTVSPFQADVMVRGSVVEIRQRKGVDLAPGVADLTISATAFRRSGATARVRGTSTYRRVMLLGKPNDTGKNEFGVFIEGKQTLTRQDDRFNSAGVLIEKLITVGRYSTPSKNLLEQVVEKYAPDTGSRLKRIARETTTNTWEPVAIGSLGPVAQKKLISSIIVIEGFDKKKVWTTVQVEEKGYSYDDQQLENGSTALTKKLNQSKTPPTLDPNKLISITKKDIGTLLVETVTEIYGFKKDVSNPNVLVPAIQSRVSDQQGGFRPGGPGRAQPQTRGNVSGAQISLFKEINANGGVDVQESFPDLNLNALKAIMAQYQAASGSFEYEVIFQGVNVPNIQPGMYINVTQLLDADGVTPIPLPVMLVVDVGTTYTEEKGEESKMLSKIRCIGWSTT